MTETSGKFAKGAEMFTAAYGKQVPLPANATAHRDERHYAEPDSFMIDRHSRDYLGFGAVLHSCLGAALARMEGKVALEEVLDIMPHWEVVEADSHRMHSGYVRGYTHLPLSFTPRSQS